MKWVVLGIAGAVGTLSRYCIGGRMHHLLGIQFPWGTLIVNISGCMAIGFLGTLADERALLSGSVRTTLLMGFLGAFTTFSSFAYETWALLRNGKTLHAGLNITGSIAGCFLGLFIGVVAARLLSSNVP